MELSRFTPIVLGLLAGCIILGGIAPAAAAVASHPFSVEDLVMVQRIGVPVPSPDGNWIVFPLRSTDMAGNKGQTSLWIVRPDGTGLRQLTHPPGSDSDPCWAPDSSVIYYLSTRSGSSQVWKVSPDNASTGQITRLPLDLSSLRIAPDGLKLAFSLSVFPATGCEETAARLAATRGQNSSGQLFDSLPVRHWDSWEDGRRNHIFVMPLSTGIPADVMRSMDADCPSKPFGGSEEYAFTPDSSGIVFAAADSGREVMWSTARCLYRASISGTGTPENLTPGNKAMITYPVFSPDGSMLSYLAMTRAGFESDRYRVMIRSLHDGKDREVCPGWDRSPSILVWSPDGKTLYATAPDKGTGGLFAIDISSGEVRNLVGAGDVSSVAVAGNQLVYAQANLTRPADLFTIRPDGTHASQITRVNQNLLSQVRMGKTRQFSFPGWNNETVYGYVTQPVDFDPAKKYPVALLIHGGPQSSYADDFSYRWNPEVFAGRGYAVVTIDFHGSVGYGQAFTDSIRNDYGGKPLEDLRKGLNATLRENPWMDGDRVSALGASYGGFMITWIESAWPDRFRCLVNHDGIFNTGSEYYTTDELWFEEWDYEGTPWENPGAYARDNPTDHVGEWKTPMLVIHGGRDYRVPDAEGLGTFYCSPAEEYPQPVPLLPG